MTVTLRDIARDAGVNVSTVSRVLRGSNDVRLSEDCRRRVLEIAERLGYQPNLHARALSGGKAPVINIVTEYSPLFVANTRTYRLQQGLAALGREVFVTGLPANPDPDHAVRTVLLNAPEAALFVHSHWAPDVLLEVCQRLHARGVHQVVVDYHLRVPDELPADAVLWSRAEAVRTAVTHLIELGHRHIGLVAERGTSGRQEGYESALADHGIAERYISFEAVEDAPHVHDYPPSAPRTSYYRRAAAALLKRCPQITALMCQSDITAAHVMEVIRAMGLRIPDDVAVAGFDGDPWTEWLPEPLTTMAQPVEDLCEVAVEAVRRRLDGQTGPWERIMMHARLVPRQSTLGAASSARSVEAIGEVMAGS